MYVVVLVLQTLTFVLYVVPLGQLLPPPELDPPFDPVQTPVVEHLVHVLLLPIKMVEQAEQDVTVPPLEYPEEQALQLFPLT